MSKHKPPAQLGLGLSPADGLGLAAKPLLGAVPSLLGSGSSLLGEPEPAEFDELDGATDEERAAALAERAKAIMTNQNQREGQRVAIELANDTEYWFAVYFQDRGQKEAFLRAIGYGGERDPDKYLDGQKLAKAMGIALPERAAPYKVGKLDRRLRDLT